MRYVRSQIQKKKGLHMTTFRWAVITLCTVTICLLITGDVWAQPTPPPEPDQAPLVGGWMAWLAAMGGLYGVKKLMGSDRSRDQEI